MDIIVTYRNIRLEVNRIRHSINMFEDYLLQHNTPPSSNEVVRTTEYVNEICNRLRSILFEAGMRFNISEIPDIQQNVVTHYPNIGYLRRHINSIRYMTCDSETCMLGHDHDDNISYEADLQELRNYIQEISRTCRLLIRPLITSPTQGGKKGKKNNKTKDRKITRKKTQKKH